MGIGGSIKGRPEPTAEAPSLTTKKSSLFVTRVLDKYTGKDEHLGLQERESTEEALRLKDRESTGTSGYSSAPCSSAVSTVGSKTGKELKEEYYSSSLKTENCNDEPSSQQHVPVILFTRQGHSSSDKKAGLQDEEGTASAVSTVGSKTGKVLKEEYYSSSLQTENRNDEPSSQQHVPVILFTRQGHSSSDKQAGLQDEEGTAPYVSMLDSNSGTELQDGCHSSSLTTRSRSLSRRGLSGDAKLAIKKKYRYIKEEVDIDHVEDEIISKGLLTDDDFSEIKNSKEGRAIKVDLMLQKVLRQPPVAYEVFLNCLTFSGYPYVTDAIRENKTTEILDEENISAKQAFLRIQKNKRMLVDQLTPKEYIDFFLVYDVFNEDEYEEVMTRTTRKRQAKELVKKIQAHLPKAYHVLIHALKSTKKDDLTVRVLILECEESITEAATTEDKVFHVDLQSEITAPSRIAGKRFSMKIKMENKELEEELRQSLKNKETIIEISDILLKETDCVVTDVTQGSIVLHLQLCSSDPSAKLYKMCQNRDIVELIQKIFSSTHLRNLLPDENLKFEIKIQKNTPPVLKEVKKSMSVQDVFRNNTDLLLEELDALSFVKDLKENGVLNEEEVEEIVNTKPISRRSRTKTMLTMIKEKDAVKQFIMLLEKKNKMDIVKRLRHCSDQSATIPQQKQLVEKYSTLVDEMSPRVIANECIARGILNKNFIRAILPIPNGESRRIQAMCLLQHILTKGPRTKSAFYRILCNNGLVKPIDSRVPAIHQRKGWMMKMPLPHGTYRPKTVFFGKFVLVQNKPEWLIRQPQLVVYGNEFSQEKPDHKDHQDRKKNHEHTKSVDVGCSPRLRCKMHGVHGTANIANNSGKCHNNDQ